MNNKQHITPDDLPITLTVRELADVLGIGLGSAYNLVKAGDLRTVKIGRQIRIPKVELLRILGHTVS